MRALPFSICAILVNVALAAESGESAGALVKASKVKAGLCVHIGATDGKLTAELGRSGNFLVHGLTPSASAVAATREHVAKQGLYGRVSVERCALGKLPYADNLANLIVVSDFAGLQGKGLNLAEVLRVLAPTGVACIDGKAPSGVNGYKLLKSSGSWTLITKPVPAGGDEWRHQNYDTSGNRVSGDVLAGPPQRLRWIAGVPWAMPDYKAKSMVVGDGRMYYVINEGAVRKQGWPYLSARDAFSGVLLWKRAACPVGLTMIAAGERFYMSSGAKNEKFVVVEGATGRLLKTYQAAANPRWAMLHEGNLLVACGRGSGLKCLDPESGKVLWSCGKRSFEPGGGLANAAIVGGTLVYTERRRDTIGCLDLTTGAEKWHKSVKGKGGMLCAVGEGAMILYNKSGINAYSTTDGKHLWSHTWELLGSSTRRKAKCYRDGFFIDGLYWTHVSQMDHSQGKRKWRGETRRFFWQGLDPETGKVKKSWQYPKGHYVGASCFPDQATTRYFMGGYSDYMEVKTGKYHPRAQGLHTSCGIGLRVAYGLSYNSALYMPGRFLQGDMAVESGQHPKDVPPGDASRLEKGPAYDRVPGSGFRVPGGDHWPIHRHDSLRTSRTATKVPTTLKELWAVKIGARPSAPTVAAGKVFVASREEHTVTALDAASGNRLWSFTAGGRVQVPPTCCAGACFFGAGDGYAYCLDSASGKLCWRFRAARTPRRIVARGRVESAWPVDEGVLVVDGLACFAAGRHGQVDGGIDLYVVEAATGKPAWHKLVKVGRYPTLMATDGKILALSDRERFALKGGGKSGRLGISGAAYSRHRIDPTYVLGRIATAAMRLRALVKAGEIAFAAGRPDPRMAEAPGFLSQKPRKGGTGVANSPAVHPLAAPKYKPGDSKLWAFDKAGKKLSELPLPAAPTWDGLAAAGGRLYLTTEDGKLRCYGKD
jgi:outer membrane protein assembly factor BamB